MSTFQRDYPPEQLSYNTLTLPQSIIPYCFAPNCPTTTFPLDRYDPAYTEKQKQDYMIGLKRYLQSRQIQYDNNPTGCPVFNSNQAPLAENYLVYGDQPMSRHSSYENRGYLHHLN